MNHADPLAHIATLVESGRAADAMQLLRDIVAQEPLNHAALRDIALLSLDQGDVPGARDAVVRALLLRPQQAEYLTIRAETSRRAGQLADARRDLADVHAQEPANYEALTSAGLVESDDGKFTEAEALFLRALEANPTYVDAIYNLARLKARTGANEESASWLARARLLRPQDRRFHVTPQQIPLPPALRPVTAPEPAPTIDRIDPTYTALQSALRNGQIIPIPDAKILGSPSSPIHSATDANQIFAPLAILAAAALWFAPILAGSIAALALLVFYELTMPKYVARKLARRIVAMPIAETPSAWDRLWKIGGLVLHVPADGRKIASPDQDWRKALSS